MKLITINPLDGKNHITVAVQDNAFDADRLEAFLRDVDELFIKKEYIEQDYAKVILGERNSIPPTNEQDSSEIATIPVSDLTDLLGMDTTLNRAADMLTAYAELVLRQGVSQLDEHHYIPDINQVCNMLREFSVKVLIHES